MTGTDTDATTIEVASYVTDDSFFGAPYIDVDEERDEPSRTATSTAASRAPTPGSASTSRPPSGTRAACSSRSRAATAGTRTSSADRWARSIGGLADGGPPRRLHGRVEPGPHRRRHRPQGRRRPDASTATGPAPRSARFSKYVAAQVYGAAPHHSYVFGGSGGGRRSPLCLENAPDAWDGALPFMGGGDVAEHGNTNRIKGAQVMSFASMFNVQRLLGPKIRDVVDAMAPGGSGDPFAGLDTHQREELASLYRQGYPARRRVHDRRADGPDLAVDLDRRPARRAGPDLLRDFWTKPGYVGHDLPEAVADDLIDRVVTVRRVLTATDLLEHPAFAGPEYQTMRTLVTVMAACRQRVRPAVRRRARRRRAGLPPGHRRARR